MNCDDCKKHLEEDNTYERILCGKCDALAVGKNCFSCKCKINTNNIFTRLRKQMQFVFGPVVEKRILYGSAYAVLLVLVAIFKPLIALAMLVGICALPIVVALCLLLLLALTVGVCQVGSLTNYLLSLNTDEDELEKLWFLGALTLVSPFVLYGLGVLAIHLFSKL